MIQWYLQRLIGMAGAADVDRWINPRDNPVYANEEELDELYE